MKKSYSTETDQLWESIEGMERATPSPFFYAKLLHKMQSAQVEEQASLLSQFKPILVIAVLSMMVLTNIGLLLNQSKKATQSTVASSTQTSPVQVFSEEYNLNNTIDF